MTRVKIPSHILFFLFPHSERYVGAQIVVRRLQKFKIIGRLEERNYEVWDPRNFSTFHGSIYEEPAQAGLTSVQFKIAVFQAMRVLNGTIRHIK